MITKKRTGYSIAELVIAITAGLIVSAMVATFAVSVSSLSAERAISNLRASEMDNAIAMTEGWLNYYSRPDVSLNIAESPYNVSQGTTTLSTMNHVYNAETEKLDLSFDYPADAVISTKSSETFTYILSVHVTRFTNVNGVEFPNTLEINVFVRDFAPITTYYNFYGIINS